MSRDAKKGHTILPLASPGPSAYDEISLDPTPRSQGRLLSPGQPGSPAKPESPFVSPTKRGRKMLQERGDRELYDGKNGKNYTIESHLEEHFKPRTLLAVTMCVRGREPAFVSALLLGLTAHCLVTGWATELWHLPTGRMRWRYWRPACSCPSSQVCVGGAGGGGKRPD